MIDGPRLFRQAMTRLVDAGVLEERLADKASVWGFSPQALRVTAAVGAVRCAKCQETTPMAAPMAGRMAGRVCLRTGCDGLLERASLHAGQYYARVYGGAQGARVHAAEHTGLLDRETRETLEDRFKSGAEAGAPNVLVCTPTLEMGIDVGDLSAVMTCAVPPAPGQPRAAGGQGRSEHGQRPRAGPRPEPRPRPVLL
jgi:DEAD/DEAH box helicase domain-containing protein